MVLPRPRLLDVTLPTPEENLALDEALLLDFESAARGESASRGEGGAPGETLRFWESPRPFVVLGVAGKVLAEVKTLECERAGIPILRRSSGGGTVVQGPGCLNFVLVLSLEARPGLRDLKGSYAEILGRMADALGGVRPAGTSDLARGDLKVSGNAQKRTRGALLHHGTLLHSFDLSLLSRCLAEPEVQPAYRAGREHGAFVANLGVPPAELKRRIALAWDAVPAEAPYLPDLGPLIAAKYGNPEWTRRF